MIFQEVGEILQREPGDLGIVVFRRAFSLMISARRA